MDKHSPKLLALMISISITIDAVPNRRWEQACRTTGKDGAIP